MHRQRRRLPQNPRAKADIEAYADMLTIAADKEKLKQKLLKTKRTFS